MTSRTRHLVQYPAPTADDIGTYNGAIIVRHHFARVPYQTGPRRGQWLAEQRKRAS